MSTADIVDPALIQLDLYWQARRGARAFPSRADIDPLDFRFILGFVALVEVRGEPRRYFFRLDGSKLAALSGVDYTGRYLDELPFPEYSAFIRDTYDRVVESGQPFGYRARRMFDGRILDEECLILPLGPEPPRVDMLLVGVSPGGVDVRPGSRTLL